MKCLEVCENCKYCKISLYDKIGLNNVYVCTLLYDEGRFDLIGDVANIEGYNICECFESRENLIDINDED